MVRSLRSALLVAPVLLLMPFPSIAANHAGGPATVRSMPLLRTVVRTRHAVGLGKVLSTADGGQIFGWDINQNGSDGLLASSQDTQPSGYKVSVETFDQDAAKVTKSFARFTGTRNTYGVDGIFAGDVGLVTHFVEPKGSLFAKRFYEVMNPVTAEKFTGRWMPGMKNESVLQNAENQSTTTSVVFAIELKNQDVPDLIVSNLTTKKSKIIHIDPFQFSLNNGPQLAQDTVTNQAIVASSPDSGAVGGSAPVNALFDLSTGRMTEFNGLNGGRFGSGFVNGLAVDSNTGIACTTTQLNAQVEFYNLATQSGIAVQLPGTGPEDELNSGAAVANDPVNKLFLVADPVFALGGGSAVVVFDESGNLVESISGFNFSNRFAVIPIRVAVNPAKRMGWVDGPNINQIQQFFY